MPLGSFTRGGVLLDRSPQQRAQRALIAICEPREPLRRLLDGHRQAEVEAPALATYVTDVTYIPSL